MALNVDKQGVLQLKMDHRIIRVLYRQPGPGELIEALVKKMPRGDEVMDAQRALMANLELGRSCITGIGQGDLMVGGVELVTCPDRPEFRSDWKNVLEDACPLLMIALGQRLSAIPNFVEESALKKTSATPEEFLQAG